MLLSTYMGHGFEVEKIAKYRNEKRSVGAGCVLLIRQRVNRLRQYGQDGVRVGCGDGQDAT